MTPSLLNCHLLCSPQLGPETENTAGQLLFWPKGDNEGNRETPKNNGKREQRLCLWVTVVWEAGEGKWTEEDYIKRAKQKINTGSADTKLRGVPQVRGLREHPSRLSWRSWWAGAQVRSLRVADSTRGAVTHLRTAGSGQWCEALQIPESPLQPLNSSIYPLFMPRNIHSPRCHFALSIVPNPGNTKINKVPGDSELNREIDLGMVIQKNRTRTVRGDCSRNCGK